MARYSDEQLKQMAIRVLQAKEQNDTRYFDFMITMPIATGLEINQLERKIKTLAGE